MLFKELKQNYPVYILDKQAVTFTQGKVISVSLPRMGVGNGTMPMMPTSSPTAMLVDVTIEADGRTATYSIPENLAVTYAGSTVLSTDREGISREIEAMRATAEQVLSSVDRQKEILDKTQSLLAELNPAYKEKKETDERFNRIEGDVSEMKSMVRDLLNKLK
nr:MAG TPA: ATP synthase subunit alpha [Caudoviricetes sp.]